MGSFRINHNIWRDRPRRQLPRRRSQQNWRRHGLLCGSSRAIGTWMIWLLTKDIDLQNNLRLKH